MVKNDLRTSVYYIWVLIICAFSVFFIQAGFGFVEAGFYGAKNTTNLMKKNLMDFIYGSIAFFATGYAIMMGKDWRGIIGRRAWFLHSGAYDVHEYLIWIFEVVFAATQQLLYR